MPLPAGLCARCRRLIAAATRRGMKRAQANGAAVGRPRAKISERDLARVRAGKLTAAELAAAVGCSAMTVRRRLRGK